MIAVEALKNGLVVIAEHIPHVQSASYDLLIPGGVVLDEEESVGASLVLGELTGRGAGDLDSKQLSDAFDSLGIRHDEGGGHDRYGYHASMVADTLPEALRLLGQMVQHPQLPASELEPIQDLMIQDIYATLENPASRAFSEIGERYYPAPYSRPSFGTVEGIEAVTIEHLQALWKKTFRPMGSVLSVAGNADPALVLELAEKYLGEWSGPTLQKPAFTAVREMQRWHVEEASQQVQIVLACPSAPFGDPHYYAAKVAMGVLSGGMFGRLFIEVREKRGLCYTVYARHVTSELAGTVMAYAGTTSERAAETLEVLTKELSGLQGTVTDEELQRAKANLLAGLVIGEESPSSRAGSNASDWWVSKQVRSLDEMRAAISSVTKADIDSYLEQYPIAKSSVLTLGSLPGVEAVEGAE